jgi:antibiotic biosynthesis monooxygenase (ABM) superfamily enzyme
LRPGTEDKPGKKHSAGQQNEWQLILRFDNEDNLKRWEESPVSRSWAARADALTVNAPKVEHVNGLEAWFTLPERNAAPAPPKWKTAIVSALAIYPLISFIPGLLAPLTRSLPMWLANLVTIVLIMPLVTWVVMPLMTRLFRPWLYPAKDK